MLKLIRPRLSMKAVWGAVLFMLLQVSCDLFLPTLTAQLINKGVATGNTTAIVSTGGAMLLVACLGIVAAAGNVYFASTQAQTVGTKLRGELYKRTLAFAGQDVDKFGASSLITRTTNDVVQIQNALVMALRMMFMAPLMLLGAGFLAFVTEARLALVFLVSLPLLVVVVLGAMRFAVPLFGSLQTKIDKLNLIFREGLTGVRVIRAFDQDQAEIDRFDAVNRDYTQTGMKVFSLVSILFPTMTLILNGTNIAIVWFGAHLIGAHQMQVGNLVSFMTYAAMILFSFMMLSMVFVTIPRAAAAAKRIGAVLGTRPAIEEPATGKVVKSPLAPTLEFKDVAYRYPGAEDQALAPVSFKAKAGQTVAVVGGTGSGKSTLVNLLGRLLAPSHGEIYLSGTALSSMSRAELARRVAFVQQQAVLFKGTVKSNLLAGDETASDAQLWRALELAQAKDFVDDLPDKLDAEVEQNGANFSGGQRQRLSIARALVKSALVYVFDDSFSALDYKTDAKLRAGLNQDPKLQGAIKLIVAQRVSTVVDADLILVLDAGKLVGAGTHKQLMHDNELYQEIVASQLKKGGDA